MTETSIYVQPAGWVEGFFVHYVLRSGGMEHRFSYKGKQGIKFLELLELLAEAHPETERRTLRKLIMNSEFMASGLGEK